MQIVEVKNNLVKIVFDASQEDLVLANFLIIKDAQKSFIAQIVYLESKAGKNNAIAKLIFTFDQNGVVTDYNGSVPDINQNQIIQVSTEEFLYLLPSKRKVFLGEIAQQKTNLILDRNFLEERFLVCSEQREDNLLLAKNINTQLAMKGQKVVIFDKSGEYDCETKITATENFKIPLNYKTIDFIYRKGLDDANAESKAIIQDVFLEVQNYIETLPDKFLPFELFKNVVDDQYKELGIVQLVLLKNKLLKYKEKGLFAQEKEEINVLKKSLAQNVTTVIDVSKLDDLFQREYISYVLSVISELNDQYYVLYDLENGNSDKKLLKQIYSTKNTYPTVMCSYSYKYLSELKQLSKNLMLFTPQLQQHDFASYNVLLNKLNNQEFIVYGKETHYIPLIVKLSELPQQKIFEDEKEPRQESEEPEVQEQVAPEIEPQEQIQEPAQQTMEPVEETEQEVQQQPQETEQNPPSNQIDEETEAQIMKDVDAIYTHPKNEETIFEEELPTETDGDFTEEDLDFIQELGSDNDSENFDINVLPEEEKEVPIQNDDEIFDNIAQEQEVQPEQNMFEAPEQSEMEDFIPVSQESQQLFSEDEIKDDIIPVEETKGSILPIYNAEIPQREGSSAEDFEKGDNVVHPKYGNGVIEKMINYGNKTLCSINFENVGRRLLDPSLADIKKV